MRETLPTAHRMVAAGRLAAALSTRSFAAVWRRWPISPDETSEESCNSAVPTSTSRTAGCASRGFCNAAHKLCRSGPQGSMGIGFPPTMITPPPS